MGSDGMPLMRGGTCAKTAVVLVLVDIFKRIFSYPTHFLAIHKGFDVKQMVHYNEKNVFIVLNCFL